jgi:hypothetical protein
MLPLCIRTDFVLLNPQAAAVAAAVWCTTRRTL